MHSVFCVCVSEKKCLLRLHSVVESRSLVVPFYCSFGFTDSNYRSLHHLSWWWRLPSPSLVFFPPSLPKEGSYFIVHVCPAGALTGFSTAWCWSFSGHRWQYAAAHCFLQNRRRGLLLWLSFLQAEE